MDRKEAIGRCNRMATSDMTILIWKEDKKAINYLLSRDELVEDMIGKLGKELTEIRELEEKFGRLGGEADGMERAIRLLTKDK